VLWRIFVPKKQDDTPSIIDFPGFDEPESNYFRLPRDWTNITAKLNSLAEVKVVEYILKHTWGYHEYGVLKHITMDELMNGRKYSREKAREVGHERMDDGTGLSHEGVRVGLQRALLDGLIDEAIDDSDRGRIKKLYTIRMRPPSDAASDPRTSGGQGRTSAPRSKTSDRSPQRSSPRTKKETLEIPDSERYKNDRTPDEVMRLLGGDDTT
jgi:hypothetical protein